MKTPTSFAKYYLENRINIPFLSPYIKYLSPRNEIPTISKLRLKPGLKRKLYNALHELMLATALSRQVLRKYNREIVKKRDDTIKCLRKALDYPRLSKSCRESIRTEIKILEEFNKEKQTYHPIKEIDYLFTVFKTEALKEKLEEIEKEHRIPPDIEKDQLEKLYKKSVKKLVEMEGQAMNIKEGRPSKFFLIVLLKVAFKLLHEQRNIPKEKAKSLVAKIINEYVEKDPAGFIGRIKNTRIEPITSKDVDNALHSP